MGYRGPGAIADGLESLEAVCDGVALDVPMVFLYVHDLVETKTVLKWEPVSGHGYPGTGMYFKGLCVDRKNLLSHQQRIPDSVLRDMLWTKAGIKLAAQQYDEGVKKIEEKTWSTKKGKKDAYAALGRACFGSRGSTKAHDMITDSILQFCVDGLHAKNNWCLLSVCLMMQQWVSFGVFGLVKKAAGSRFGALFGKHLDSKKNDVYSVDGNIWSKFILEMPKLLRPILVQARKSHSRTLLRLYTQHMEFGRCLAEMVKTTCTMDPRGFEERIPRFEEASERWVQLILLMDPDYYTRTYVQLARYVLPFMLRYVMIYCLCMCSMSYIDFTHV